MFIRGICRCEIYALRCHLGHTQTRAYVRVCDRRLSVPIAAAMSMATSLSLSLLPYNVLKYPTLQDLGSLGKPCKTLQGTLQDLALRTLFTLFTRARTLRDPGAMLRVRLRVRDVRPVPLPLAADAQRSEVRRKNTKMVLTKQNNDNYKKPTHVIHNKHRKRFEARRSSYSTALCHLVPRCVVLSCPVLHLALNPEDRQYGHYR